jgi:hypothetical protein
VEAAKLLWVEGLALDSLNCRHGEKHCCVQMASQSEAA